MLSTNYNNALITYFILFTYLYWIDYTGPERASASANGNMLSISFECSPKRTARAHSPFHHSDYLLSPRSFHASSKDFHPPTVFASPVAHSLSYRSKSYHGELNRITSSTYRGLSEYNNDLSRSERSQLCSSRSAYNINESYRNIYTNHSAISINAYSNHYNHHNFWTPSLTPQPLNNRFRFQKRNAYKAHRSRSAYPLVERYDLLSAGYQNSPLQSRARVTASQDFQTNNWTKSLFDIHSSQATLRGNRPPLFRYSSVRSMFDDIAYVKSILNPDVYLRWLRSKRNMEDVTRRYDCPKYYDNDIITGYSQRVREMSYLTRSKRYISSYGKPYNKSPSFEKPIKGNSK